MAGNGRKSNFNFKLAVESEKLSIQDARLLYGLRICIYVVHIYISVYEFKNRRG